MTHAPPIPEAQRAPFPAHPAPMEKSPEPATPRAADEDDGRKIGVGTAIGVGAAIGSAAIAAALLYVNYGRKK